MNDKLKLAWKMLSYMYYDGDVTSQNIVGLGIVLFAFNLGQTMNLALVMAANGENHIIWSSSAPLIIGSIGFVAAMLIVAHVYEVKYPEQADRLINYNKEVDNE